ncbi:hypothetical protein ACFW04_000079 [Cataglyphis niger]
MIASIIEQSEFRNATDKKTARKIFTDSIKAVIENKTAKNAINKQLSEVDEKLFCINEVHRTEDVLYKKLANGDYICDICQIVFEQKNKILRHIMSKHSFHRPFRCAVCEKSFKYKYDLKMHRLVHQKVNSDLYCCGKCNYRVHSMCDICGRFYMNNYSLYKHRKVAHLNEYKVTILKNEYKFHCNICNKKLLTQENLDNHMQQHDKTYKCKECGKAFTSKRYLTNHAKTHTGIKPYTCHICEKTEKPYIRDLCGQTFKRRYDMIVHRRKYLDAHLSSPPMPLGKRVIVCILWNLNKNLKMISH